MESRSDQSMGLWDVAVDERFGGSLIEGLKGGRCAGGRAGTSTRTRVRVRDGGCGHGKGGGITCPGFDSRTSGSETRDHNKTQLDP